MSKKQIKAITKKFQIRLQDDLEQLLYVTDTTYAKVSKLRKLTNTYLKNKLKSRKLKKEAMYE